MSIDVEKERLSNLTGSNWGWNKERKRSGALDWKRLYRESEIHGGNETFLPILFESLNLYDHFSDFRLMKMSVPTLTRICMT